MKRNNIPNRKDIFDNYTVNGVMQMNDYKKMLEFLDWEFGVFFHFGIRSFFPGHKDWDGKEMPICQIGDYTVSFSV